jgi:hypothetical protein
MLYHQFQLFFSAWLAQRFVAANRERGMAAESA